MIEGILGSHSCFCYWLLYLLLLLLIKWRCVYLWQASMSAATQNLALDLLQNALSSRLAYAVLGSVQSLTHEGARTMWRDGQHCAHAPSTSMRGVVEQHTLPECLMFVYPAVGFSQL